MANIEVWDTLDEAKINEAFNMLALSCGHSVLGRLTELKIYDDDFSGDTVLARLSSTEVKGSFRREIFTVKQRSEETDVVKAVLRVTHPDIYGHQEGKNALDTIFAQYVSLDQEDPHIQEALADNYTGLVEGTSEMPDLLRGMEAFAEAEQNMWGGVYSETIINPAKYCAAWLITHERVEPLE